MSKRHLLKVGDRVGVQRRLGVLIRVEPDEWYTVEFDDGKVERHWRAVSYMPTEDEIADACREIRSGLSPRELESKAADPRLREAPWNWTADQIPSSALFGDDVYGDGPV